MKTSNITLIIITLLFGISLQADTTFYVTQNGTGQGASWKDAAADLNAVLFVAKSGDQIWVAKGTYKPTLDSDRNKAFFIPTGVKVYGGFKGNEKTLQERNTKKYNTILSGAIKTNPALGSYNVVVFKNANIETVLDGFIIEGGRSNGVGNTGKRARCGGGIYNDGAGRGNQSNPTIANCIFRNNFSRDGGAVYNNGVAGQANPTFTNCSFEANEADFDGGAIFNDGRKGGQSNPKFFECQIVGNKANYGGGVCNYAGAGESSPLFENCFFNDNNANVRGGGMYNMDIDGICEPVIKHCRFTANDASTGASYKNISALRSTKNKKELIAQAKEWSN